jgi:hypothetical protein
METNLPKITSLDDRSNSPIYLHCIGAIAARMMGCRGIDKWESS